MSNFDNLRTNLNINSLNLLERKTTIIDQIPNYNSQSLESYIKRLDRELQEQQQINTILQDENYDKNITEINHFLDTHSTQVENQLDNIKNIVPQLKKLILDNKKLKQNKQEYNDLLQSAQSQHIAQKMLQIKSIKNDISSFLEENGV